MLATLMQQRKKSINIKREKNTQLLAINNDRKISAPAVILTTTKNKISSSRLAEVNSAFVALTAAAATSESDIVVDETTTTTMPAITRNRCFSDTKTAHVKRGKGVFLHWQQWSKRQNQQQVNDQYQQKHCTLEEEETNQIDDACVNSNQSKNIKRSTSSFAALREEEKDENNDEDFVVNKVSH
ncbi:unnamed protein product [Meloidogyne enterolobii]|uniref:Uncharacterized protein n=2 Tax=Meloidogyne enterolobii TaxID=390850 RepID=A0ACB0XQT0_MELEN